MSDTLRWTWPMSTPGSIGAAPSVAIRQGYSGLVELLVDQPVRLLVALPADVLDRPVAEILQCLQHLLVQPPQGLVLDLVLPRYLAHDQLRIADQLQPVGAERLRALDPEQQRPVLGDVVGRGADRFAALLQHLTVSVLNNDGDRRRARVSPRPAVDVDAHRARL